MRPRPSYLTQQAMLWTFLSRISSLLKRLSTSQPLGKDVTHDIPISLSSVCKRDMISNGEGESRRSHAGSFEIPRCFSRALLSILQYSKMGGDKEGRTACEGGLGYGKTRRRKMKKVFNSHIYFFFLSPPRNGEIGAVLISAIFTD